MEKPEPEDAMEKLERRLNYNKDVGQSQADRRHTLEHRGFSVRRGWRRGATPEEIRVQNEEGRARKTLTVSHYVLIFSVIFFFISAGVAAYFFFGGVVSPRKIDITIAGPVATDAGNEVPLQITITNTNAVPLVTTDLIIHFPEGTRSAVNPAQEMVVHREALGDLLPGGQTERTVRAALYGEQGETKVVRVTFEYQIAGSSSVFVKEQEYELVIGSSSVRLSVESILEVNAGQEMEFTIEVASNSAAPINDLVLLGEYPSGFAFTSAAPEPTFGTSVWRIGTLGPDERRTIIVRGVVEGENEAERVFRFTAGIQNPADETRIGTPLLATIRTVGIKKPFLGIALKVNNTSRSEHVVGSGETVDVLIEWKNNLPTPIVDGEIVATLTGTTFDKGTVKAGGGLYRATTNTITWNAQTTKGLLSIEPGQQGTLGFSFSTQDFSPDSSNLVFEPSAGVEVSVRGRRVSEGAVPEEIKSTAHTKLVFSPAPSLTASAAYSGGPFTNTGPIPPKVDTETTFTITWRITNTTSDVTNAEVVSSLPANVRWVGALSPAGERMTFIPVGGRIVWDAGLVPAGAGRTRPAREVSFQVALTPSLTEVGSSPTLVNEAFFTGTDTYTKKPFTQSARSVTTRVFDDPALSSPRNSQVVR